MKHSTLLAIATLATAGCLSAESITENAANEAVMLMDEDLTALKDRIQDLEDTIDGADTDSELGVLLRLSNVERVLRDDKGELIAILPIKNSVVTLEDWRKDHVDPTLVNHGERITTLEEWRTDEVDTELKQHGGRLDSIEKGYATTAFVAAQIDDTEDYCDDALSVLDADLTANITDLDDSIPGWILADTTWTVDGVGATDTTFITPSEAVSAAHTYRISPNAMLTIEIVDATYTAATPLEIRHPDGAQLEIVGNTGTPSAVELHFTGSHGIVVQDGYTLGLLDGVTIQGDGKGTSKAGVTAQGGSFARLGEAVVVQGFSGFGLKAVERSVISAEGVMVQDNTSTGIHIDGASAVFAKSATVQLNKYHGVSVASSSYAYLESASVIGNSQIGVYLLNGSTSNMVYATTNENGIDGVRSFTGSSAYAVGATSSKNKAAGFTADRHSIVRAEGTTATSNGTVAYTPSIGTVGNLNSIIVP